MAEFEAIEQSPGFKDRKTRLVVFGVLQIILGSICALFIPLMIFGAIASRIKSPHNSSFRTMIPVFLIYSLAAIWFIFMGIGSIKAKRWARALILISSWFWLICGTLGFVFMMRIIPNMFNKTGENSQQVPAAVETAVICVMIAFMAGFYIIIPGLLVLFYSGRNVKATVEYRDPQIRWTDKCPLPVLAISFISAVWAISMFWMAIYNWAIPFFGILLSGIPGAIITVIFILLLAYTVYGTYKLDMKAWWCALLVFTCWFLSAIITFSQVDMLTYYQKMGYSQQQIESMKQYVTMFGSNMSLFMGFWAIVVIAYLVYIRRYFTSASH
ncbi:MAG: hypothetical protein ABSE89_04330 [Sedimentisphaerales bacterium]